MVHFGANLRNKNGGLYLTRDNYITVNTKSSLSPNVIYDDDFCQEHSENCLKNYDINMEYFHSLDFSDFDQKLVEFLQKFNEFKEIKDLREVDGESGYYIMVLDKYCQVYIGTSKDIKRRIMSHWSKTKQFDRLIFGTIENSILSVDSFRALDTTRIFVATSDDIYSTENTYIDSFDRKYILNRTAGGIMPNGLTDAMKYGRGRDEMTKEQKTIFNFAV